MEEEIILDQGPISPVTETETMTIQEEPLMVTDNEVMISELVYIKQFLALLIIVVLASRYVRRSTSS